MESGASVVLRNKQPGSWGISWPQKVDQFCSYLKNFCFCFFCFFKKNNSRNDLVQITCRLTWVWPQRAAAVERLSWQSVSQTRWEPDWMHSPLWSHELVFVLLVFLGGFFADMRGYSVNSFFFPSTFTFTPSCLFLLACVFLWWFLFVSFFFIIVDNLST